VQQVNYGRAEEGDGHTFNEVLSSIAVEELGSHSFNGGDRIDGVDGKASKQPSCCQHL
jgi:hypothetical protein